MKVKQMGDHITSAGWNNWGNPDNEKSARYFESGSKGPGANDSERVKWARKLPQ